MKRNGHCVTERVWTIGGIPSHQRSSLAMGLHKDREIPLVLLQGAAEVTREIEEILQETLAPPDPEDYSSAIRREYLACEPPINGVDHGNRGDPWKRVEVALKIERLNGDTRDVVRVIIEVTDEGELFSLDEIPDPTDPANLENDTGRGIFVLRNAGTSVTVHPCDAGRGKRVRFEAIERLKVIDNEGAI